MNDSEQCSNRLQFDLISLLVTFGGGQMSDFEQCLNSPLVNFLWPESQFRQNKWRSYQADRPLV